MKISENWKFIIWWLKKIILPDRNFVSSRFRWEAVYTSAYLKASNPRSFIEMCQTDFSFSDIIILSKLYDNKVVKWAFMLWLFRWNGFRCHPVGAESVPVACSRWDLAVGFLGGENCTIISKLKSWKSEFASPIFWENHLSDFDFDAAKRFN